MPSLVKLGLKLGLLRNQKYIYKKIVDLKMITISTKLDATSKTPRGVKRPKVDIPILEIQCFASMNSTERDRGVTQRARGLNFG